MKSYFTRLFAGEIDRNDYAIAVLLQIGWLLFAVAPLLVSVANLLPREPGHPNYVLLAMPPGREIIFVCNVTGSIIALFVYVLYWLSFTIRRGNDLGIDWWTSVAGLGILVFKNGRKGHRKPRQDNAPGKTLKILLGFP